MTETGSRFFSFLFSFLLTFSRSDSVRVIDFFFFFLLDAAGRPFVRYTLCQSLIKGGACVTKDIDKVIVTLLDGMLQLLLYVRPCYSCLFFLEGRQDGEADEILYADRCFVLL